MSIKYGAYGTTWTDANGNMYYRVAKNDTLWTIAQKYYGNALSYKTIYELNRDKIKDPHWIYPNQVILLKKGKPQQTANPNPAPTPQPATPPKNPEPAKPPVWTGGEYMDMRPTTTISKQEYVLGIYDTEIKSTKYSRANAVIIQPNFENKNIREISINANESHPKLSSDAYGSAIIPGISVSDIITSVEYYISYGTEWIPILPLNTERIKNEYMFFNDSTAELRFKADVSHNTYKTRVYKNGILLENEHGQDWFFTADKKHIRVVNYDSSADYTVDYVPLKNEQLDPTKLLITEEIIKNRLKSVTETFSDGTDANMKIMLSQVPYVDGTIINKEQFNPNLCFDAVINGTNNYPVSVVVDQSDFVAKSGRIVPVMTQNVSDGGEIHLKNITDYKNKDVPSLTEFDAIKNPFIEFYHLGRNLYFPERFKYASDLDNIKSGAHGNGRVHVSYKYPDINIKLKVILRRTTDLYDKYISPTVTSIKVNAKVIK